MEVDESYDILFDNWDYENVHKILPLLRKCVSTSSDEREILRTLELSFCFSLKNFPVDKLEDEFFQVMCPVAKNLIMAKINYLEKNPSKCFEGLSVCLQITSYLKEVFQYLIDQNRKISITDVKGLLTACCDILLECFSHCKVSEDVYGTFFPSLTECLSEFFKKCVDLNEHLLNFLTEKAECDVEDDRVIVLLHEVTSFLSKCGILLIDLDVKTMAKVWKGLAFLMEKYSGCLRSIYCIGDTVKSLCDCIILKLELVASEGKDIVKIVKLNRYLLQLLIKFLEVFVGYLGYCQQSLFNLLLMLCRFDISTTFGSNQDLLNQFISGIQPLLSHVMTDQDFVKEFSRNSQNQKSLEFLLLCCLVLKKLSDSEPARKALWFNHNENILKFIFSSFSSGVLLNSTRIRLPDIIINGQQKKYTDLYEYILITVSLFLMTATAQEYCLIEEVLLQNVMQEEPIKALLAIDVWCLLARFADSDLCLSQILTLSKMYQYFHPGTLPRIEKFYLGSLIRRLFPLLVESHREVFLKSFRPSFYSYLWEVTGIHVFTPNEDFIVREGIMSQVGQLLNEEATASFELGVFESKVIKLWRFDCNVLSSTSQKFSFLKIICAVTGWVVSQLPLESLYTILSQLKKLLSLGQSTSVKLYFTWILNSLSTVKLPPGQLQKRFISTVADIFRELLLSKEILLRQKAFETFYFFSHLTSHGEVISLTVQNAPQLKLEIANYLKKKPPDETSFDFNELSRLKFEHLCLEVKPEMVTVSKKVRSNEEVDILTKWKETGKKIIENNQFLSESEIKEIKNVCDSILSLSRFKNS